MAKYNLKMTGDIHIYLCTFSYVDTLMGPFVLYASNIKVMFFMYNIYTSFG